MPWHLLQKTNHKNRDKTSDCEKKIKKIPNLIFFAAFYVKSHQQILETNFLPEHKHYFNASL
jgi:hypothetical protein